MIHTQSNSKQSCYDLLWFGEFFVRLTDRAAPSIFNSQATMVEFHWTALSASIPLLPLVSGFKTFKIQQCKTNAVSRVEPSEIITFCLSSQLAPIFSTLGKTSVDFSAPGSLGKDYHATHTAKAVSSCCRRWHLVRHWRLWWTKDLFFHWTSVAHSVTLHSHCL